MTESRQDPIAELLRMPLRKQFRIKAQISCCGGPPSTLIGSFCLSTKSEFGSTFKLAISGAAPFPPIEFNQFIGFDGSPFKSRSPPRVIGSGGKCETKAFANFHGCRREEPSGGLLANDRGELILPRKCNNHFRCACGMPVHEQNDRSMKRLFSQPFGLEHDWLLGQHCRCKLQGKRPERLGR